MTVVYLDANALAKLYVEEPGSDLVERTVQAFPEVVVSAIGYAEVRGVLARHLRDGSLTEAEHDEAAQDFDEGWEQLNAIDVRREVSRLAGDLLKAHRAARLRAMDALHLATALAVRRDLPLRLLTFDADLAAVARALMPGDVLDT